MTIRSILILTVFFLSGTARAAIDWNDKNVKWHGYSDGMMEAKSQGKNVVLIVYADWCPTCEIYSKTFFNESVIANSRHVVLIRLNQDRDPSLSEKYSVDGKYVPRTYILDSDFNIQPSPLKSDRHVHFLPPDDAEYLAKLFKWLGKKKFQPDDPQQSRSPRVNYRAALFLLPILLIFVFLGPAQEKVGWFGWAFAGVYLADALFAIIWPLVGNNGDLVQRALAIINTQLSVAAIPLAVFGALRPRGRIILAAIFQVALFFSGIAATAALSLAVRRFKTSLDMSWFPLLMWAGSLLQIFLGLILLKDCAKPWVSGER